MNRLAAVEAGSLPLVRVRLGEVDPNSWKHVEALLASFRRGDSGGEECETEATTRTRVVVPMFVLYAVRKEDS